MGDAEGRLRAICLGRTDGKDRQPALTEAMRASYAARGVVYLAMGCSPLPPRPGAAGTGAGRSAICRGTSLALVGAGLDALALHCVVEAWLRVMPQRQAR